MAREITMLYYIDDNIIRQNKEYTGHNSATVMPDWCSFWNQLRNLVFKSHFSKNWIEYFTNFYSALRIIAKNVPPHNASVYHLTLALSVFVKPGDTFYPKDENGKHIYHETDLCATWEVRPADLQSLSFTGI